MSQKKAIYQEVLRQYERIRSTKQEELRLRRKAVYEKNPRVEQIEQKISMTGIRIARMVLQQPKDAVELMAKLRENLTELRMEKERLLLEDGFSKQELEMQYLCPHCKDTGYIGQKQCRCMKQKLMDAAYDQSNVRDIIKVENFDTFDLRYYRSEKIKGELISPRENIQGIFRTCFEFAEHFDTQFTNLLLYGGTGLGKTFLCNCMAKELLDQGKTVLYVTAGQLFKLVEECRFQKKDEEESENYMEDILDVDLFIIDDLGTEFSTILSSSELFVMINSRLLQKKPVIISTNLSPEDLIHQYSDRIVSRLLGDYKVLKFLGDDIRVKKKFMK